MTNFRPRQAVFGIVILVTDKTRILGFVFSSLLGWRFSGILLRLISFILSFSFLFSLRGFICRGGLDDVNLESITGIGYNLRNIFIRSIQLLLPMVHGRFLRGRLTEPMIPSTNGVGRALEVPGLRVPGK